MNPAASEALWQSAPHPALRVWAGPPARCSPNEAARIDGMEVMRRMRAQPCLSGCHIVALSANAMEGDVKAALAAGFDACWTKPIDFVRFLANLDALAAQRGT